MKNFPVFIFPVSLEFYLNARHTHRQLITVYNPYDFAVDYKVLCTSSTKFTVIDPEGTIAAQSCIDIVVRCVLPSLNQCKKSEKFRITIYDRNTQQTLGKRDIIGQLIEGEPSTMPEVAQDHFHSLVAKPQPSKQDDASSPQAVCYYPARHREQQPVNVVAIVVSIFCVAALLLPTQPEAFTQSQLPDWLHIGVNLKLVTAFLLGLVTMLVLKP